MGCQKCISILPLETLYEGWLLEVDVFVFVWSLRWLFSWVIHEDFVQMLSGSWISKNQVIFRILIMTWEKKSDSRREKAILTHVSIKICCSETFMSLQILHGSAKGLSIRKCMLMPVRHFKFRVICWRCTRAILMNSSHFPPKDVIK